MASKIAKCGFEIEGEYTNEVKSWLEGEGVIKGDGSLRLCPSSKHKNSLQLAEYNSKPFEVTNLKPIQTFFNKLDKFHKEDKFHFNDTCGFHIHVSFTEFPPEIFSRQFTNHFLKALKTRQKTVLAKRGNNHYCSTSISDDDLRRNGSGARYKFVNLWPAYRQHGTIEFRIFPANNPKTMYRYIVFTLGEIRKFMKKPIKIKAKAKFETGAPFVQHLEDNIRPRQAPQHFTGNVTRETIVTSVNSRPTF